MGIAKTLCVLGKDTCKCNDNNQKDTRNKGNCDSKISVFVVSKCERKIKI